MYKRKEVVPCKYCGESIRFIKSQISGEPVAVNAKPVTVVPCIGNDKGGQWYLTLEGKWFRGREKTEENLFYDGVDYIAAFRTHVPVCSGREENKGKKMKK